MIYLLVYRTLTSDIYVCRSCIIDNVNISKCSNDKREANINIMCTTQLQFAINYTWLSIKLILIFINYS